MKNGKFRPLAVAGPMKKPGQYYRGREKSPKSMSKVQSPEMATGLWTFDVGPWTFSRFLSLYPLPLSPSTLFCFAWLREAEPISGVVLEDGFDAVGPFRGFGNKLDALCFQFFISSVAVIGIESARA
jgi:hypothetical protein